MIRFSAAVWFVLVVCPLAADELASRPPRPNTNPAAQTLPATAAPIARPMTKPALRMSRPGGTETGRSGSVSPLPSLLTMIFSLAVVLSVFLGLAWVMRRSLPPGTRLLPAEVVEVLGRIPLAGRQQAHLVRCGNKLLLLAVSPGGAETLTEITDPVEVDRLAGLCRQSDPQSTTTSFRHVFEHLGRAKVSPGFVGRDQDATGLAGKSRRRTPMFKHRRQSETNAIASKLRWERRWRSRRGGRWLVSSLLVFAVLAGGSHGAPAQEVANSPARIELTDNLAGGPQAWTSPTGLTSTIQVMLLLTVLSMAPAVLLMTTCFVRVLVVLSLLRQAFGTQQLPPSQVITSLALFVTLLVMTPVWKDVYDQGIRPYTNRQIGLEQAWDAGIAPVRRFMSLQIERTGNSDDVWLFLEYLPGAKPNRKATTTCRCRRCCRPSCSAN